MDPRIDRLTRVVECNGRDVIDKDHPVPVEAVGSQETLVFEVDCEPGDEGLIIGAPCRPWTEPHGHTSVAAIWEFEKPRQEPVTRVGLAADESAMAGEGVGHD
jgi:hypothetical protein